MNNMLDDTRTTPIVEIVGADDGEGQSSEVNLEGEPEGVSQEQFATLAQLTALKAEILQAAERTAQSYADKTASRLDKRVKEELGKLNDAVAMMKAGGVEMTDAQIKAARQNILDKVLLENDEPTSPTQNSPSPNGTQGGPATQPVDPISVFVTTSMEKLNKQHGIALNPEDPEAEGMDQLEDPFEFIGAYQVAIAKKAERLSIPPQARVASVVGGAKPSTPTLDATTAELAKLLAHPTLENLPKIRELQAKLSSLRGG